MDTPEVQKTEIVKHPKRLPITFVSVVFVFIAIYFAVQGIILLRHHSIEAYNVSVPSSDSLGATHEGILLRSETVYTSPEEGYVSFYSVSGEWMAREDLVASLDPAGDIENKLRTLYYGYSALSYASRVSVQKAIRNGVENYDPIHFETAVRAKSEVEAAVMNALLKDGGEELKNRLNDLSYTAVKTGISGFFLNWTDGFENKTPEELRTEDFKSAGYEAAFVRGGSYLHQGDLLYKLATDNQFTLCFLPSDQEAASLSAKKTVSVRMSDGLELSGAFSFRTTADGKRLGVIEFVKYGANYLNSRYVSFRIIDESVTGFKIPESSIVQKSFFVVPRSYIGAGGKNENGVMLKGKDRNVFVPATVYVRPEGYEGEHFVIGEDSAYVYSEELSAGMTIIEYGDERREMTLGVMATVDGCFQINSGYCVFKPVIRLRNSIDTSFVIIQANLRGSIKAYDRIVLDAGGLKEAEIIYE